MSNCIESFYRPIVISGRMWKQYVLMKYHKYACFTDSNTIVGGSIHLEYLLSQKVYNSYIEFMVAARKLLLGEVKKVLSIFKIEQSQQ